MRKYNPQTIEKKWQKEWDKSGIYRAKGKGKKWYSLIEFPYPSGDGLHVGHVRSNTAMDIISRKRRMEGYDVLYPIGWDAFGLPTENYAIKTGVDPRVATKKNTDNFRRQLKALGFSFDWSREINTTDPSYYKWTQWLFLQFFKHGLAYKAQVAINWCPKDKIGLANEEAVGGVCDRCGGPVEKRMKEQWMLKITAYAEKLLDGLKDVDYISQARTQQENWIGKSEGALIKFPLRGITNQEDDVHFVEIFTTRPDTIFGATFVAISPELAKKWIDVGWKASDEVVDYVNKELKRRSETREDAEKTGVFAGINAVNPANKEEVPVWVTNYVLGDVGTGAIMAVPAHDERDSDFARKYDLPVRIVVEDVAGESSALIDSAGFSGMDSEKAKWEITRFVHGERKIQYRLRDWVFSRQRYWGEPIPLVNCEKCGWVPVPEKELPLELPKVKKYQPRDDGQSPLASVEKWVSTKCPKCKSKAMRETDTMPNWAGSSWYFFRYIDPKNKKAFASPKSLKYFTPVDWYNGGMEHTVLHLLYSRFWSLFLYDIGLVPNKEPYKKRTSHGLILAEGGIKMSKSKGNVINPDDVIKQFGADALRLYEMFMGPFDQAIAWDTRGILGVYRFLEKVWRLTENVSSREKNPKLEIAVNKLIKKVGEDIESMAFNTALSAMMVFINTCQDEKSIPVSIWKRFLLVLAPFAPYLAEDIWRSVLKNKKSIHREKWPVYDPRIIEEESFTLVIQVNGKLRDTVEVSANITENEAKELVFQREKVKEWLQGKEPRKVIYIPKRLVNIVI